MFSPECVDAILRLDFVSSLDLQSLIVTVVGVFTGMRVKELCVVFVVLSIFHIFGNI